MNYMLRTWLVAGPLVFAVFTGAIALAQAPNEGAGREKEGVKIRPYTGKPIYLDEPELVAAPTVVGRDVIKEQYKDGKLRIEREIAKYSDDHIEAEGTYREYHPNGQLFVEGQFRRGRQNGDWTYHFENGQLNRKVTYNEGKLNGAWDVFRADGTLSTKRGFKDGQRDGAWVTYDKTGKQPLTEEHYVSGKEDGTWKVWYPTGQLKLQFGFKQGVPDGVRTEWDEKGNKRSELTMVNGKVHGTATGWSADGKKIIREYKDGRLIKESKE
jgi:antitoxin component YwqK of YwqJK toxin-antitoxin module